MNKKITKIKPVLKSFNCPNCGATLKITAVGLTVSVVCSSCNSVIDANDPNYKILEKKHKRTVDVVPVVPIGSRGTIAGKVYECIGFIKKEASGYYWMEYLLYNPYIGFRWLVESDGHWSITTKVYHKDYSRGPSQFTYKDGRTYSLFDKSEATVNYVEGEFYWRVKAGDKTHNMDYISPPFMMSLEADRKNHEYTWSRARYLEPERVAEIFKIKNSMPKAYGVGACQPSPWQGKLRAQKVSLTFSITAIFIILFLSSIMSSNEVVYSDSIDFKPPFSGIYTSRPFTISENNKNVEMDIRTNVQNQWVYLDTVLVNNKTGQGYRIPREVSYYSGYDWSEGSKRETAEAFQVPSGEYILSIAPQRGGRFPSKIAVSFRIISNTIHFSNFIWAFLFIIIGPIILWLRYSTLENERWENSDYAP